MKSRFYSKHDFNRYRQGIFPKRFPCVVIDHVRIEDCGDVEPKGGMTVVRYWISDGCAFSGVAFCCNKDTYNKRKGKSIAFGRLIKGLERSGLSKKNVLAHMVYVSAKIGIIDNELSEMARKGEDIQ